MSGQHVVYGFLRPFLRWAIPDHDVVLLHLQSEHPPEDLFSSGMGSIPVTNRCRNWLFRSVWEAGKLPTVIKAGQFDVVLNMPGRSTADRPDVHGTAMPKFISLSLRKELSDA